MSELHLARGYRYAGVHAGVKVSRKDLALIVSETPASAAAVVTRNQCRAACADRTDRILPAVGVRAILISSGNANCLSGPQEARDDERLAELTAEHLALSGPGAVLTAQTGGIGKPLPMDVLAAGIPLVIEALGEDPASAAEAILTTDKAVKLASRQFEHGGKTVTVTAIGKGSGMIHPDMATMLAFLLTDVACAPDDLRQVLREATGHSFNQTSVDRDTSTNDVALLLANGVSGVSVDASCVPFVSAVRELCQELARMIAADGEGATRLIAVEVSGAPDEDAARELSRAVVTSSLFKSSLFGDSAGWPRALAAIGAHAARLGLTLRKEALRVTCEGVVLVAGGHPTGHQADVRKPEVNYLIELGLGEGRATAWGCDLSYDYVTINAVTKSDPLETHSPGLKRRLLVEALSYIRTFKGRLAVIKYGGAAMLRDDLKDAFAEDVALLKSAGLQPVVVHGGGPEISRTLAQLGEKSRFEDGIRVTDETSVKVVEMVLTGRVNTDVVTRIHTMGGQAVGLSGKDGGLLQARKLKVEGKDLGLVGEVEHVETRLITTLLDAGYIPVISPVGVTKDGQTLNINADTAAAQVAVALGAEKLIFLTDVPGILGPEGTKVSQTDPATVQGLIESGAITGGMIPKVEAMLTALKGGVSSAHIIDGRVPHNLLAELFTERGVGTWIK
ncbi:MAG: bifunctional glutamate N-acetyltransferase/amino-acid acetyltransferase ArgJ [Planctomycetes bacterium]|nr:bifunctional glutamate N-acetyltransferase/amino-acid acetyltransferase ArgJ [Planctomycetota bacterium]